MMNGEPLTRSEFLKSGIKQLFRLAAEVVNHQVETKAKKFVAPLHRPPGAIDELSFLTKCTRCDRCIEACPHDAIVRAEAKYGSAVDTPVINPSDAPCYLCEDMPCIEVCPDEALLPVDKVKMGTAYIARNKCFAFNGQVGMCDYCFDRCPLKGEAIVMDDGKPRVITEACLGCGVCEYFCPAPGGAIKVIPEIN